MADDGVRQVPKNDLDNMLMRFCGFILGASLLTSPGMVMGAAATTIAGPGLSGMSMGMPALTGPTAAPGGFSAIVGNVESSMSGIGPALMSAMPALGELSAVNAIANTVNPALQQQQGMRPSFA